VQVAFGQLRAPIYFAIDAFYAHQEETVEAPSGTTRIEGGTMEYAIGVRKVFRRQGVTHPHLGAGAAIISANIETSGPSGNDQDDDTGFGYWIDGGITWRLASHLNLGVEVRYSRVKLEFGDIFLEDKVPGGGFHAGALVGFGW
jgi:opacity protein-like surface antigen